MTVKELIMKLSQYPQDAEIMAEEDSLGGLLDITSITCHDNPSKGIIVTLGGDAYYHSVDNAMDNVFRPLHHIE